MQKSVGTSPTSLKQTLVLLLLHALWCHTNVMYMYHFCAHFCAHVILVVFCLFSSRLKGEELGLKTVIERE